jgi:tetraacyldisaccharide-1-P 4'-kinase
MKKVRSYRKKGEGCLFPAGFLRPDLGTSYTMALVVMITLSQQDCSDLKDSDAHTFDKQSDAYQCLSCFVNINRVL